MSSVQVEMIKPSILNHPEKIDTIAILYSEQSHSDSIPYTYYSESRIFYYNKEKTDTAIHYKDLYRICIDALVNYIDSTKYFVKAINYSDSINNLASNKGDLKNSELYSKLGIDACIYLNPFEFNDLLLKKGNDFIDVKTVFPEFANSTDLEYIFAKLPWTIYLKGDTTKYVYDQYDDLYYGNSVYPEFFGSREKHKQLVENTAVYFGKTFGSKLIPSWRKTERSYYISKNIEMMKAEEFCRSGKWLKAAEIYRRYTQNKNKNISNIAKYNMALVCEMEGNIDAAIDWLNRSKSDHEDILVDHLINCARYSRELEIRKKELELLKEQIGN